MVSDPNGWNTNTSRSGRDTAWAALATLGAGIIGSRLGLSVEEVGVLNIVFFAMISFGYRALRRFAPWATDA